MGGRILAVRGPSLGVEYKLRDSWAEKACQGLAFRLRGPALEQELDPELDPDLAEHGWVAALVWDAGARVWREPDSGAVLSRLSVARWGHTLPVPTLITVQIHSPRGSLLHEEERDGVFSFVPRSRSRALRLRQRGGDGQYTTVAVLHAGEWQSLPEWPQAGGRRGLITLRTPLWQRRLYEIGRQGPVASPLGPRQRLSSLAGD